MTTTQTETVRSTTAGLVACDIDWTLLKTGQRPSDAVVEAVAAVREAGHHLVLATARSLLGAVSAAKQLGMREGHIVASNGAVGVVIDSGQVRVLWKAAAPAEKALRLVAERIESGHLRAATEIIGVGYRVSARFPDDELPGTQAVSNLEGLWSTPTPRLVLRGAGAADLQIELQAAGVGAFRDARRDDWLDVVAPRQTKAIALDRLRAGLGVHPRRTAAIGDGENDLGMLTGFAAVAFVMGNATQRLRDDVVAVGGNTTGTVDEDGAAHALADIERWMTDSRICQWWTDDTGNERCDRPAVDLIGAYWRCDEHTAEERRRQEGADEWADEHGINEAPA